MENGVINRLETATKLAAAAKEGLTRIPTMDAQALLLTLNQQEKVIESLKSDLSETLDVVTNRKNVVRCGDCKWYSEKGFCKHPNGGAGNIRPADWFCADGKGR